MSNIPKPHTEQTISAQPTLAKSDLNLVWLDCEMSGLEPDRDRLLEIAVIVTSPDHASLNSKLTLTLCPTAIPSLWLVPYSSCIKTMHQHSRQTLGLSRFITRTHLPLSALRGLPHDPNGLSGGQSWTPLHG